MTISRTGIMGTRFRSCFSRVNIRAPEKLTIARSALSGLFEQTPIDLPAADHFRSDNEVAHFALHGEFGDGVERIVGNAQTDVFEFEQALILLEQRVLGLRQDANQNILVEV